jgi:hypothetical protein
MNVLDGFAAVARKGEQRVLRTSRALRPNAAELSVGPLHVDIRAPAFIEAPYRFRKHGHLFMISSATRKYAASAER